MKSVYTVKIVWNLFELQRVMQPKHSAACFGLDDENSN